MKKLGFLVIVLFSLFSKDVFAKDTALYLNQYEEENFLMMQKSYNEKKEIDGFLVGGVVLKETIEQEEESYLDYQVLLVKYDKNGNIVWTLPYGNTKEDQIYFMDYMYDEENQVTGYLIGVEKTYDRFGEQTEDHSMTTFLKVTFDGKIEWEKSSSLNRYEKIHKLIPINQNDGIHGYIGIGTMDEEEKPMIIRYNKNLEIVWMKEYQNEELSHENFIDLQLVYSSEEMITGYALLLQGEKEEQILLKLLRYDLEGNLIKTVIEDIPYETASLASAKSGYTLYGITSEVKLSKGENSYYFIHYSENDEEEWEVVGDLPVSLEKPILLRSTSEGLVLLYQNSADQTYEVIELDQDGLYKKKVKKIPNNYYDFQDFTFQEGVLYFVGQIECPEEEDCYQNHKAVFLRSDKDKVIEVKDETSAGILIVLGVLILFFVGFIWYHKREQ